MPEHLLRQALDPSMPAACSRRPVFELAWKNVDLDVSDAVEF
jgi:hypothetical protein